MNLKAHHTKNGYDYQLLAHTETAAIYHQTFKGLHIGHEVFYRKKPKSGIFNGRVTKSSLDFPHDGDFGRTAWSITNPLKAWAKYHEIARIQPLQATQTAEAA